MGVRVKSLVVLLGLLVGLVTLSILSEQWGANQVPLDCTQEEVEIVYVTVTVTVSPLPGPPHKMEGWRTEHWCTRNPDYSEICFYEDVCFDGRGSLLFIDPDLYDEEEEDLAISESVVAFMADDLDEKRFRIPTSHPATTGVLPFSVDVTDKLTVRRISPDLAAVRDAIVVEDEVTYLAFQRGADASKIHPIHFIESNIMLYEVQRQNVTFGSFMDYPSLDHAYILRPKVGDRTWESDLLALFIDKHTKLSFWEDLDALGVSESKYLCMKRCVGLFEVSNNVTIELLLLGQSHSSFPVLPKEKILRPDFTSTCNFHVLFHEDLKEKRDSNLQLPYTILLATLPLGRFTTLTKSLPFLNIINCDTLWSTIWARTPDSKTTEKCSMTLMS